MEQKVHFLPLKIFPVSELGIRDVIPFYMEVRWTRVDLESIPTTIFQNIGGEAIPPNLHTEMLCFSASRLGDRALPPILFRN